MLKRMKVSIRRNLDRKVRLNAEQIDGNCYWFYEGWAMDEDDPYSGEIAYIPRDDNYPDDAPHWIASGDLIEKET